MFQIQNAGFDSVKEMTFGMSLIPDILEIDDITRFENSICLEAVK